MDARRISQGLAAMRAIVALGIAGCNYGTGSDKQGDIDRTPKRLDGSSSQEFESGDIERAEGASDAVAEYCSGAVSEAQEVGCLSHVDESDIP